MTNAVDQHAHRNHITICACTYRRQDGLRRLLASLARQEFNTLPAPSLSIVIADNEVSAITRQICTEFAQAHSIPLTYVPVEARGISHARNACFEAAPQDTDFFAIIDDDEIPDPDWLEQLIRAQIHIDADVVYGPVTPALPPGAPSWIERGRFFEKPRDREQFTDLQEISFAATCNCFVRAAMIYERDARFDPAFALSGGEDKLFFRQLKEAGYRFVWAANARVTETVPPERARIAYLWRSEYRLGNVKLPAKLRLDRYSGSPTRKARLYTKTLIKSVSEITTGVAMMLKSALPGRPSTPGLPNGALRVASGIGMLASAFGITNTHYR